MKPFAKRSLLAGMLCTFGFAGPASAASEAHTTTRPDRSAITWYLDHQDHSGKQPILVLGQGSGCSSVAVNPNIRAAKRILPDAVVITVEKYGVHQGDTPKDFSKDCSKAFFDHHTVSERVKDYRRVLAEVEKSSWWNGKLVLFGGSEGGAVMQLLAPEVHPNAAIIFSSATGVPFREAFVRVLPPSEARQAQSQIAHIRRSPNSSKLWLGNTYRWWSDIMDRRLSDRAKLARGTKFLIVQGTRDESNPVFSARAFVQQFRSAHLDNVTYWELPYDHTMVDRRGTSHLQEVLANISAWTNQVLQPTK